MALSVASLSLSQTHTHTAISSASGPKFSRGVVLLSQQGVFCYLPPFAPIVSLLQEMTAPPLPSPQHDLLHKKGQVTNQPCPSPHQKIMVLFSYITFQMISHICSDFCQMTCCYVIFSALTLCKCDILTQHLLTLTSAAILAPDPTT